jgi:hypothetical protein
MTEYKQPTHDLFFEFHYKLPFSVIIDDITVSSVQRYCFMKWILDRFMFQSQLCTFLFTFMSCSLLVTSVPFSFYKDLKNITWNITELVIEERYVRHIRHRLLLVLFEIRSVVWRCVCHFIVEALLMYWHPAWKNKCVRPENFIHVKQIPWNMKKQALKYIK